MLFIIYYSTYLYGNLCLICVSFVRSQLRCVFAFSGLLLFLQLNIVVNLAPQRKSCSDVLSYRTQITNLLRNRHWIHTWCVHVLQLFGWLLSIGHWQLLARLTFCDQISGKQFGQSGFERLQTMISRNVFHPLFGTKKSGPCKTTGKGQQLFVVDSCIITFTDLP